MNTLSFFTGIGGLELGIPEYLKVLCHCDKNKYCEYLIRKHFGKDADFHSDICSFPKEKYENINLIMGGFPCQDISNAGKGKGLTGNRSGLIWVLLNLVEYYSPEYVFLENVSNLKNKGLDKILIKLDELGFNTRWTIINASAVGALHNRRRTFILAKNRNKKLNIKFTKKVYDSIDWTKEPNLIERVISDPNKERIKCLGNAVIPQQSRKAFHILSGSDNTATITDLDKTWANSSPIWNSNLTNIISKCGSFNRGQMSEYNLQLRNIAVFPPTIQRFKTTHSLPTPTASDHISRKPTNTIKARAFRPGVNKSVSLNRWIEMFPHRLIPLPELDDEGYLIDENIKGLTPNPEWIEWLMGFSHNWTK